MRFNYFSLIDYRNRKRKQTEFVYLLFDFSWYPSLF